MKYIFAGNLLEYTQYVSKQNENGFLEIRSVEQLKNLNFGDILFVIGHYDKKSIWPEIEAIAKEKGIIIKKV